MKILALLSFFNFLAFLYLGFKIYRLNKESALNQIFLAVCVCFSVWSVTFSFLQLSETAEYALFWHRAGAVGWISFSSIYLHFSLVLCKQKRFLKTKYLLLIYFPAVFFSIAAYSGFMLAEGFVSNDFGWIIQGQRNYTLFYIFTLYYTITSTSAILLTFTWNRNTKNIIEKKQSYIILTASSLTFILGTISHIAVTVLNFKVPMPVSFFLLFWVLGVYYALTNYRFLSINTEVAASKILQSMNEAVILIDTDYNISYANQAFCKIFKKNSEQISGKNIDDIIPIPHFTLKINQNKPNGIQNSEYTFFDSYNQENIILVSSSQIFDKFQQEIGNICIFNDITKVRLADREQHNHEELYRKIILASPDAVVVTNMESQITFASPITAKIFGLSDVSEMLDTSLFDWFPEYYHEFVNERLKKLFKQTNEVFNHDYQLYRLDRSTFWAQIHSTIIVNQNNQPHEVVSIVTDISERKTAHEAMKVSEERLRQLIENSSDISWVLGLDFRYQYMSPAIEKFQGYTVPEVMGKHFSDLMPEKSIKQCHEAINDAFRQLNMNNKAQAKIRKKLIVEVFHKNGTNVWCEIEAFFKHDENGNVVGIQGNTRDVTDRVKAEEKLRESEEKYRRIFEASPIGIFSCKFTGELLEANSAYCQMFGFSSAEEMRNFIDLSPTKLYVHPERRIEILNSIDCENLGKLSYENEFYRKDGSIFIGHLRISTIYNSKNKENIIEGVVEDITERILAEKKIRSSDERFRALTQNSIDMIAVYETSGKLKFITPIVEKIMGYTHQELISLNEIELIHPDDRKKVIKAFVTLLNNPKETVTIIYRHKNRQNKYIWLESIGSNQENTPMINGLVVNTREITARKDAQDKLIYHRRFEELVSQVSRMFIDPSKNFDQNLEAMLYKLVVFLNLELANIIFFDEKLSKITKSITAPVVRNTWKQGYFNLDNYYNALDVYYEGDMQVIDLLEPNFFHINDLQKLLELNIKTYLGIPIIVREELVGVFNLLSAVEKRIWETDELKLIQIITEIIRNAQERLFIEEQLHTNAEELKNLVETKNTFFSIVAHDIKNPFNSIIGLTRLLTNNYDIYSEEERRNMIFHVYDSSEKLYSLLENLLYWSRSQSGSISFVPEAVNLADVTNETTNLLQYVADQKKINLYRTFNDSIFVFADKNMLTTTLRNLISNALKFTGKNGKVKISAQVEGDFVQICIEDTGIGIRPEVVAQLFQQDLSQRTKPLPGEGRGTGLGLVLCREFTEKQGGYIKAESIFGQGTKMIFTIPLFHA